jgi:valyl-tRNA synthetase
MQHQMEKQPIIYTMSQGYTAKEVESKWYSYWLKHELFTSKVDEREPFTIVIPPPNVTGVLHMGHMLNNTIQDVFIRHARMQGKNACWVPGTDHASIATEAKVVGRLREQGIKKSDLTREEFLKHAWAWTDEYGGVILDQLKRLGASCDWSRTRFTLEEDLSEAVNKVFVELYNDGKIYRDWKIVNWDPKAQTTLSNEEVIRKEVTSQLYYIKYKLVDQDDFLTVATTRPETIMGDTAICVHPDDERYKHLIGKRAIVPIVNREVPIIADTYIDREFGTGVLKVTPAHDTNDYEIGQRHNLESIDVLNPDGSIADIAGFAVGEDRFEARKLAARYLKENDLLIKNESIQNSVGYSERNADTVVEPRRSLQWFVRMDDIVKPALDAVLNGDIDFIPTKYVSVYKHWLDNIRDWPISRQLWWGHSIPAYYVRDEVFVAESKEEALALAQSHFSDDSIQIEDLVQDPDALDTWFSSWLWPISVFDGFKEDQREFDYYYPTQVLVTGWDIIFFWVARMIFAGYTFKNEKPFEKVYFTGMVRDMQRRKMSKSLGNSPDALKLMDHYGADGVRFGVLSCAAAGNDLLFEEKLCENGRNFTNKLYNAFMLIDSWNTDSSDLAPEDQAAIQWFEARLEQLTSDVDKAISEFRLSEALMELYKATWTDFCSWYLEFVKRPKGEAYPAEVKEKSIEFFNQLLQLLHPFMPFITEELWQNVEERKEGESICVESYPIASASKDKTWLNHGESARRIITGIRDIRQKASCKNQDTIKLTVYGKPSEAYTAFEQLIVKMTKAESIEWVEHEVDGLESFVEKGATFYVDTGKTIDVDQLIQDLEAELSYTEGFVKQVQGKLSNARFVDNAPSAVVEKERQKLKDGLDKIEALKKNLSQYKS